MKPLSKTTGAVKNNHTGKTNRKDFELISKVNLNIKLRREKLGLSQQELSELTGLHTEKYESGTKDMNLSTLSLFAKHLKLDPHNLIM